MFHLALSFGTNAPAAGAVCDDGWATGAVCDDGWAGRIEVLIIGTVFVEAVAFPTN